MRFLCEGPNIPDRLLTARDDGQVVFLCGAGVSMPCQLPSFKTLTEDVLRSLKVPTDADAQQAFSFWRSTPPGQREVPDEAKPSFDLIFNMLQQSYGRDEVGKIVAERLAVPTNMIGPSRWHRTVARLSADQTGAPQIVTTNFDLLFEVPGVMDAVKTHVPPTFPDLRHDQPISGITYLHGRLNPSFEGPHNYVLSSADFGRAYLADGWATNFMRLLLERYTVVLLGYRTRRKIARQGWTPQTMRDFASSTAPVVELELPYGIRRVEPPSGLWSELNQADFFRATVKFRTDREEKIEVIDDALPGVFAVLNSNLIRAVDLLNEIGNRWLEVPSLYRDVEEEVDDHVYRSDRFILWFLDMLERMADLYPAQVAATTTLWPQPEGIVFDRLRMFVWNKPKLFMASQAADLLLQLEQSAFWHPKNRRELLFLIRDRWESFSLSERLAIEERLLAGPDKYDFQSDAEYPVERAISISMKLTWLVQAGCAFSEDGSAALAHQKSIIPDWDDGWARSAASATSRGKAGYVVTNSDPEVLLAVADADIVATLLALPSRPFGDFTEDRPFKGLVTNHPARAMNALELAAQRGEYPPELWRTLIHDWPDTAPEDATRLFHDRLRQLPAEVLQSLHHTVGDWIRDKLPAVAKQNEPYAMSLLDDLLDRLLIAGVAVTESGISDTFEGGQRVPRSRRTYAHATNALVGKATEALASMLNARELPKDARLPQEFSTRFERLLASPGEGSDHAVSCLAIRLPWLTYIAPDWAKARLLPLFAVDHPAAEPAWSGLLYSHHIPRPELFVELKTQLLSIFPKVYSWNWDSSDLERAHDWVVQTCIWHQNDDRYTSYDEAIACIRTFTTAGRVNVIHFLGQVGRNGDGARQNAVVPFIKNAWPREAQYQIEATSAAFVSLLEDCGDDFPAVFEAVSPFLRQIHRGHRWLYRFYKEIGEEGETPICVKFPRETFALLDAIIPDDPAGVPTDLGSVLDQMVEAWPKATRDRRFSRLRELAAAL